MRSSRTAFLSLCLLSLSLIPASRALGQAGRSDPLLWPEPQRAFFQDGPGLLLTAEQKEQLLALPAGDAAGRDRLIAAFLDRDPQLRTAIERRSRLATAELPSPADVRAQLLFLNGAPADRHSIDCGTAFKPLEIWTYRAIAGIGADAGEGVERRIVVYRPAPDEPFKAWTPGESKRALYTPWMENWLEQWEEFGARVRRFDMQICKEARKVDVATGIPGLTGARTRREKREEARPRVYGMRPDGSKERLLDPPGDLAAWARKAAQTPLAQEQAKRLEVTALALDFPARDGQRMVARGLLTLPAGALGAAAGEPENVRKVAIDGLFEQGGKSFDDFRTRYKTALPAAGEPIALSFEQSLRPGEPFLLRLRIKDEGSGAETRIARAFLVPKQPAPSAEWNGAAVTGESVAKDEPPTEDSLVLLPPEGDVVLGLWRAEALVTGRRIRKVDFLLDGKPVVSRTRPPYTTEVRIGNAPAERVVRAEGYDAAGALVASDEVALNRPRETFRVEIKEPAEDAEVGRRTKVKADVIVPEGRRVEKVEVSVNDVPAGTIEKAPWELDIDVPDEEVVYVTVSALLDDASRLEDVRFLRAPDYIERLDVRLIELYAAVTDRSGRLVPGLTAADFELLEGGKAQPITKFELVENLPLTIGITLDTSGSMESRLSEAREAAAAFLRSVVSPGDRSFALRFDSRPLLLVPPTDDVEAVVRSVMELQAVGGTALHDALIASLHYFRETKGQRVLVLLSDGDDTASTAKFSDAIEYARRSGVSIYTIGLGISAAELGARGKLSEMAESTGGRAFFVSKASELDGIYGQIEQEVRSRYLIAFQAEKGPADQYRQIELRAKRGGLKVRTARGYYP